MNQAEKDKCHVISLTCESYKTKQMNKCNKAASVGDTENKQMVAKEEGNW